MLWNTLVMARRALAHNALRSVLTTLGIVIGVSAVIAMLTLGEGAAANVKEEIAGLGERVLVVVPGNPQQGPTAQPQPFRSEDAPAIAQEVAGIAGVAPNSSRPSVVVYGNRSLRTMVVGSEQDYFDVLGFQLAQGRTFSEGEITAGSPVCILGATVQKRLFPGENPIGARMRIERVSCEVIGTLQAKGRSMQGSDRDDLVVIPFSTFQRRLAEVKGVDIIFVKAASERWIPEVKREITSLMRQRRRIAEGQSDNFSVHDMREIIQAVSSTSNAMTALLGAIAAVSLLVGGIGIMNIMMVSVTERTREIGVRMATGARTRDILLQFLIESTVVSTLGGLIGIALGLSGSYVATQMLGLPFLPSLGVVVLAFVVSAVIGVFFGYYPARKAARMQPVEALRYD
jgi:putative ABC transport system permease protein